MARARSENDAPDPDATPEQPGANDEGNSNENAENSGAVSAQETAVRTGVSQDDLNPAFASPERQEEIKKNWEGGAEHEVDAEAVLKEQENNGNK